MLVFLAAGSIALADGQDREAPWSPKPGDWPASFGNFQSTSSVEDPKFKPPFRLKWATRLEGQMKSTPVVGDGRVFAQTVNGLLMAMDQETGRILWRNYHPGVLPANNAQNRAGPLYADGRLYYAFYPGGFRCVDAATGEELWKDPEGTRIAAMRCSGLYYDGLVFYPYWVRSQDNKTRFVLFKALDAATGREVWRKEFPELSAPNSALTPSPPVSTGCIGDGVLYVTLGNSMNRDQPQKGWLLALDPRTGKEVWKNDKYFGHGHWPHVAFRDGRLYVGGAADPFRCLDAKTGGLVWESEGKSYWAGAVGGKGVAMRTYGSVARMYDLATGKPLYGKDGKQVSFGRAASTGCSPLILVNDEWGIHHSGGESRRLSVGRVDRAETAWEFQLAGRACPGSAVSNGCIFTPSNGDGLLYCFEPDDGGPAAVPTYTAHAGAPSPMPKVGASDWPQFKFDGARSGNAPAQALKTPLELKCQVKLDAPCFASPAVMDGKVFVVDAAGTAYGIDPAGRKILWKRPTGGVNNRSSPVAVGGKIYFGSADRNFYMLDALDGSVVRKLPMPHIVLSSPALTDEGRIYVESFDGTLFALDLDANVLWALKLKPSTWWLQTQEMCFAPHDVAARGNDVLAVAGNSLFKVRDEGMSGKVVWTHHGTWASGASFLGETFFAGNAPAEQENQALRCLLDDALTKRSSGPNGDGRNEYTKAVWGIGRVNTPPSANATRACFGSVRDGFWCVDLMGAPKDKWAPPPTLWSTSRKERESYAMAGANGFVGGAALTQGHCVFGGLDGKLYAISLDARGVGLDKIQPAPFVFEPPEASPILSTPAISNGTVYFTTTNGTLYGLASGF